MTDQRKIGPGIAVGNAAARADFFNRMIGALSETIEDVVGVEDAETFIGVVGRRIGNSDMAELQPGVSDPQVVADHLVAFKDKIGGTFQVDSIDGDCITFTNGRCPFGDEASGRPSLCQMTTNVFGRVAANATGFARVHVAESLARGDARCLVSVRLSKPMDETNNGQDFYG